jgi:hypothetical protein
MGFIAWKPYGFTTFGLIAFFAGAVIGFIFGLPFWLRSRRRRQA